MIQWCIRGSMARDVHLGFRTNLAPLADAKLIWGWKLILFNCEASWDDLLTSLSLGHSSNPDFLSYFLPRGVFFWQVFSSLRITVVLSFKAVTHLCESQLGKFNMLVMYTYIWMCKELIGYHDCMWYISCECMHVCMPRAMYASGCFSAGFPK